MSQSKSNLEQQIVTKHGWHIRFDVRFDPEWRPFSRPRAKQLVEYVPLFMRYDEIDSLLNVRFQIEILSFQISSCLVPVETSKKTCSYGFLESCAFTTNLR